MLPRYGVRGQPVLCAVPGVRSCQRIGYGWRKIKITTILDHVIKSQQIARCVIALKRPIRLDLAREHQVAIEIAKVVFQTISGLFLATAKLVCSDHPYYALIILTISHLPQAMYE